jgi:hypothetical protein
MQFFKKDHIIFGAVLGLFIPVVIFGLILLINYMLLHAGMVHIYLDRKIHILISITGNLVPIRYYFVNLKFDKTGRGVLLVTFILFISFFAFKDKYL